MIDKILIFTIWILEHITTFFGRLLEKVGDLAIRWNYRSIIPTLKQMYSSNQVGLRKEKFILKYSSMLKNIKTDKESIKILSYILSSYDYFLSDNGAIIPKYQTLSKQDGIGLEFTRVYSCELDTYQMADDFRNVLDKLRYTTGDLSYSNGTVLEVIVKRRKV